MEYLSSWCNDEKLSTYLQCIPYITEEAQIKLFDKYLEYKNTLFFSIINEKGEVTVGAAVLCNSDKDGCGAGKIVIGDPSSHGKEIGYRSLLLAITVTIKTKNSKFQIRCTRG